ncbi:proline-rich protein 15-like protein isoform X1 [Bubalus bubalis]|uniref:proline-rich protein 15-like protein isoform X1 n=1 Tax=Bubalus bubalis TaxID=89462 RepID=UPI00042CCB93|nr:proline-rich protein 15-like protein isoform X1 [Bubalus bubalis]
MEQVHLDSRSHSGAGTVLHLFLSTCCTAAATQLSQPEPCLARQSGGTPTSPSLPGRSSCTQLFSREALASSLPAVGLTGSPTLRSGNAMTEVGWWKLTFLRKKKSTPKVLYEIPDTYTQSEGGAEPPRPDSGNPNSNFNTRLEKIVDKNTKGKHVKVSNSGRFKEKKKVRASLAENPNLFDDREGKGQ